MKACSKSKKTLRCVFSVLIFWKLCQELVSSDCVDSGKNINGVPFFEAKNCRPTNCSTRQPIPGFQCSIQNYLHHHPDACMQAWNSLYRRPFLPAPQMERQPLLASVGLYGYHCQPIEVTEVAFSFSFYLPANLHSQLIEDFHGGSNSQAVTATFMSTMEGNYFTKNPICRLFNYTDSTLSPHLAESIEVFYDCIGIGMQQPPLEQVHYYLSLVAIPSGNHLNYTIKYKDLSNDSMRLLAGAWRSPTTAHFVFMPIKGIDYYHIEARSGRKWTFAQVVNTTTVMIPDIPKANNAVTVTVRPASRYYCRHSECKITLTLQDKNLLNLPADTSPPADIGDGVDGRSIGVIVSGILIIIFIVVTALLLKRSHFLCFQHQLAKADHRLLCVSVIERNLLMDFVKKLKRKNFSVKFWQQNDTFCQEMKEHKVIIFIVHPSRNTMFHYTCAKVVKDVFQIRSSWEKLRVVSLAEEPDEHSELIDIFECCLAENGVSSHRNLFLSSVKRNTYCLPADLNKLLENLKGAFSEDPECIPALRNAVPQFDDRGPEERPDDVAIHIENVDGEWEAAAGGGGAHGGEQAAVDDDDELYFEGGFEEEGNGLIWGQECFDGAEIEREGNGEMGEIQPLLSQGRENVGIQRCHSPEGRDAFEGRIDNREFTEETLKKEFAGEHTEERIDNLKGNTDTLKKEFTWECTEESIDNLKGSKDTLRKGVSCEPTEETKENFKDNEKSKEENITNFEEGKCKRKNISREFEDGRREENEGKFFERAAMTEQEIVEFPDFFWNLSSPLDLRARGPSVGEGQQGLHYSGECFSNGEREFVPDFLPHTRTDEALTMPHGHTPQYALEPSQAECVLQLPTTGGLPSSASHPPYTVSRSQPLSAVRGPPYMVDKGQHAVNGQPSPRGPPSMVELSPAVRGLPSMVDKGQHAVNGQPSPAVRGPPSMVDKGQHALNGQPSPAVRGPPSMVDKGQHAVNGQPSPAVRGPPSMVDKGQHAVNGQPSTAVRGPPSTVDKEQHAVNGQPSPAVRGPPSMVDKGQHSVNGQPSPAVRGPPSIVGNGQY